MRIISGKFKNKKILLPSDKLTRPLKDIVRESIFNVIEHSNLIENEILNSSILDLYSGSGSFGLECLSRGASRVDFCENYPPAFEILKKNLNHLNCANHADIYNDTVLGSDGNEFWFEGSWEDNWSNYTHMSDGIAEVSICN